MSTQITQEEFAWRLATGWKIRIKSHGYGNEWVAPAPRHPCPQCSGEAWEEVTREDQAETLAWCCCRCGHAVDAPRMGDQAGQERGWG